MDDLGKQITAVNKAKYGALVCFAKFYALWKYSKEQYAPGILNLLSPALALSASTSPAGKVTASTERTTAIESVAPYSL